MTVSSRHILEQGTSLGAVARALVTTLEQQVLGKVPKSTPPVPGPLLEATYPPRSQALVQDYVKNVGGDPAHYANTLPPHMFPQWSFGLAGRALQGVPYRMSRVLNPGCNYEVRAPLPADEPLHVSARLESIDDDGRRALMKVRVVTSTPSVKEGLVAELLSLVPLSSGPKTGNGVAKEKKEQPQVPEGAREVAFLELGAHAGLDFAKLTGDFNPIHWIPAAARAAGFRNVILHGYGTMARTLEGLNRGLFGGDVTRIKKWSCSLTKPLVLPAKAAVLVKDNEVFVGVAPGGPAYLIGNFET